MPIVGDVLAGRYRIDGMLGAGGMASVYQATDQRLERQVAVKVLLPNLARDPSLAGRFDREARMLAAVAHPSVAAIFDVEPGDSETGREPFYVMELCDGGSLADRIRADGAIPPEELVPILGAVSEGLAELHRNGVVHRDVKPGNILFAGGRPKLADFGLAKSDGTTDAPTLTAPGTLVGTLPYLAPELLTGGAPTTASDVYALGATAFHGLTGRLPKPFDSLGRFMDSRWTPAPTVSSVMPSLGTAFDHAVAGALAIEPAARPAAAELAAGLTAGLEEYRDEAPAREAAAAEAEAAGTDAAAVAAGTAAAAGAVAATGAGAAAAAAGTGAAPASRPVGGSIAPPTMVLPPAQAASPKANHAPGALVSLGALLAGLRARVAGPPRRARRQASRRAGPANPRRSLEALGGIALLLLVGLVAFAGIPAGAHPAPSSTANVSPSPSPQLSPGASPSPKPTPAPIPVGRGHHHHQGEG